MKKKTVSLVELLTTYMCHKLGKMVDIDLF